MIRTVSLLACLAAALAMAGCHRPIASEEPTRVQVVGDDFEALWDGILRVLRRSDFRPDRQDRRAGIITTHPVTAAQYFEFWRQQNPDGYQALENNLHTVRRRVTVSLNRGSGPTYHVDVRVDIERHSAIERQVTTASGAAQIFASRMPTVEGEATPADQTVRWVPVGRDAAMERVLLGRILSAAPVAAAPPPETQPAG